MTNILVIGASSAIGQAFISQSSSTNVIAISRQTIDLADELPNVTALQCDYSEADIACCTDRLRDDAGTFSHVVICNGILHGKDEDDLFDDLFPEKTLNDLNERHLSRVLHANAIVPALWISALMPIIKGKTPCKVAVFSARVGSIGDNRLGGWYSYRASKSALNMLLKTASIEYARRAKNVKLIAFHPGTTDTDLSKPFQANVSPEKLFTPDFVAQQLRQVMDNADIDGELSYKDWENKDIIW